MQLAELALNRLIDDSSWVLRRKHAVELLDERLYRHHISLDLKLPADLPATTTGEEAHYAPLLLLRKAPGRFTRFDFRDETGRALSLPSRRENGAVSAALLLMLAERTLGDAGKPFPISLALELRYIAHADAPDALEILLNDWYESSGRRSYQFRRPRYQRITTGLRGTLTDNATFWWAIRELAHSSIVTVPLAGDADTRRIVKLSYDEVVHDWSRLRLWPVTQLVATTAGKFGYRPYQARFALPFVAAHTFHFEMHLPLGLEIVDARIPGQDHQSSAHPRNAHLYLPDPPRLQAIAPLVEFRARGTGSVLAGPLTSVAIAAIMVFIAVQPSLFAGTSVGAAPSLLVLIPGLIASYLARPEHPIVSRLLSFARWALIGSAGVAYVGAARLAIISQDHPATARNLRTFFTPLAAVGCVLAGLMLLRSASGVVYRAIRATRRWRRGRRDVSQ